MIQTHCIVQSTYGKQSSEESGRSVARQRGIGGGMTGTGEDNWTSGQVRDCRQQIGEAAGFLNGTEMGEARGAFEEGKGRWWGSSSGKLPDEPYLKPSKFSSVGTYHGIPKDRQPGVQWKRTCLWRSDMTPEKKGGEGKFGKHVKRGHSTPSNWAPAAVEQAAPQLPIPQVGNHRPSQCRHHTN